MKIASKNKMFFMVIFFSVSIFLSVQLNIFYKIDTIYTHFFYLPIVLSAIWFHYKSIYIAIFLGFTHVLAFYISAGQITPGPLLRAFMFFIIAVVVSVISSSKDKLSMRLENEVTKLERFKLFSKMAGTLAQELINPLAAVSGLLKLYRNKEMFEAHRDELDIMIDELNKANLIINEYLSLSKDCSSPKKHQNINDLIKLIYPLIQGDAIKIGSNIKLDLGEVPYLYLDELQIRQLIINLVNNGLEAMPKDGEVTIKTSAKDNEVVLSIEDQGEGISPEIIGDITTPFFTTKENGTGLGLAVCYNIVIMHNADMDFETGPGGTKVLVKFKNDGSELP